MSAFGRSASALALALSLGACATMSGSGPSASAIKRAPSLDLVHVTVQDAAAAQALATAQQKAALDRALAKLRGGPAESEFRFADGDTIDVTVWSFSPWPGGGAALGGGPAAVPIGTFTLAADGTVLLPYAGRVVLSGLTLPQAQQAIAARYARLKILQGPTATVRVAAAPLSDVLVTGAVGQPKQIPWSPAGLTLAQALTQALGDGNATLGQGDLSPDRAAVRVGVIRGDETPVEIPVAAAFEESIHLRPGDRVIVRKAPVVEVTMLGGGTRRNGVLRFAKHPVLSEAIAEANGLDGNGANDHAVFVLRRRDGARPVLYDFAWKRADGLLAAQQFPLEDGDIVYVAEAPIVSIQKVIGLLFQVTLPAQVLK